jgi:pimeloyl-ACP methyl ester carboxylesterase
LLPIGKANYNEKKINNRKAIIVHMQKSDQQGRKSRKAIVLVHGGFVDGSGWAGVYNVLKDKGYIVAVVQNPTKSLADDVAYTKAAIDSLKSEVVLVGHSYGGVVITEAGTHPEVTELVYIAAFAPDKGESVSSLIANPPPGAPFPPILPRRTASCFSTRTSSLPHLPATLTPRKQRSRLTLKSRGASKHWVERSVKRHGGPSRVGI